MSNPRIGSLFTGYGGLDMAVEDLTGGHTVWTADPAEGPAAVIARRFGTDVPNLGDVTAIDWATVPPVDILVGGSPCQDVSHAGRRAGMAEGTRSNLWVAMREAIAQLQPGLVVWENVRGALSARAESEEDERTGDMEPGAGRVDRNLRALGRVLGDLTDLGYDARWTTLRASDIGAPHQRARVFLIAYPADAAHHRHQRSRQAR